MIIRIQVQKLVELMEYYWIVLCVSTISLCFSCSFCSFAFKKILYGRNDNFDLGNESNYSSTSSIVLGTILFQTLDSAFWVVCSTILEMHWVGELCFLVMSLSKWT